jgi:DNA/RNA endonuclease G (NUC1)
MAFELNLTSTFLVSIKRGMEFAEDSKIPKDQTLVLISGIRT